MPKSVPPLPDHLEEAIETVAKLQRDHAERAGPLLRWVQKLTAWVGQPAFVPVVGAAIAVWIAVNTGLLGLPVLDPPPFPALSSIASVAALLMTGMILATQRHDAHLSYRREQLTLQLSLLSEQKAAKVIEMMENLRRDHPDIPNRIDIQALDMAASASLQEVVDANDRQESRDDASSS